MFLAKCLADMYANFLIYFIKVCQMGLNIFIKCASNMCLAVVSHLCSIFVKDWQSSIKLFAKYFPFFS